MTTLAAALTATTRDLTWLCTIPHTLDHVVVVAQELDQRDRRQAAMASAAATGGGSRPSGHSDPTGDQAVAGIAQSAAEAVRSIDAATALLLDAGRTLGHQVDDALGLDRWHPPAGTGRCGRLRTVEARIHRAAPVLDAYLAGLSAAQHTDVEHLVRDQLAETAAWLHAKASGILADARPEDRDQPVQRARRLCTSCSRFGLEVDVEHYRDRCRNCGNFQQAHGCLPTERIIRTWHAGLNRVTPGMVLEAKAQGQSRARRKRGA
ncbi:hypothetical protein KSP35_13115 [Aquihabitans sp. G128]|uniref:hypothetical protein n=1 Tax=Aquihabitans sp. G128 TaxID=2849779 RepID=UPI001C2331AF|nr:hypothetical protein [Aquihabitans sp. G128]QXC59343.1 hypothetical protein KSP35_13115 [Aquihabitans sp. G128]